MWSLAPLYSLGLGLHQGRFGQNSIHASPEQILIEHGEKKLVFRKVLPGSEKHGTKWSFGLFWRFWAIVLLTFEVQVASGGLSISNTYVCLRSRFNIYTHDYSYIHI